MRGKSSKHSITSRESRDGRDATACEPGDLTRKGSIMAKEDLDFDAHEQVTREIQPARTADFPTPAERPLFSALNCDLFPRTFGLCLPPWEEALAMAMENRNG